MKYEVKKKAGEVEIKITFEQKEWNAYIDEAYNKSKGKYKVEGFRTGKVPRPVIENMYGKTVFYEDALNDGFSHAYMEILDKEKDLDPVDMPKVDVEKMDDSGIVVVAKIATRPEIKLGAYKGLDIAVKAKTITVVDVDAELNKTQLQNARLVEKKGVIAIGDTANIDFEGYVDGKKFEGGTSNGFDLEIGSHSFIDTFEDQLIGLKEGDKKDVKVSFPKNYQVEELAGKPAVFKVAINSIKQKELPEIDDEFASNVSSFETLAEYRKEIKDNLKKNAEQDAEFATENKIIDKIVEGMKVSIPDCMIDQELENIMQDIGNKLMYQGLKFEDYLKYLGITLEDFKAKKKADAEKAVKIRLAMQEIIKIEKIDITSEEIDAKVKELADKVNKSVEEYKKIMGERLSYIGNEILLSKLMSFLIKKNAPVKTTEGKEPAKKTAKKETK